MDKVDPRYFNWGERFDEGVDRTKQNRLQEIALGQQQEDRNMRLEDRQRAIAGEQQTQSAKQAASQYENHVREATTLLNAAKALKGVPAERRRQTLESWGQRNPIIGGAIKQIPPDADLSDAGLDDFAASMGIMVQGYGQPQGNSDFLRAVEIIKNPNASPQERQAAEVALGIKARAAADSITPYQQAQLDIEREKLNAKAGSDETKANSAVTDKIKVATGIARAKQGYAAIDAARSSLVTLDELDAALADGAQFGPVAGRLPSYSGATQRGETAFAKLGLANIKSLPGPASDKDIAFIKSANLNEKMDNKTLVRLIPKVREAAQRVIEKNMQVNALIEQGLSASEAEAQVWGTAPAGPGITPQPQQSGPSVSNW